MVGEFLTSMCELPISKPREDIEQRAGMQAEAQGEARKEDL